MGNTSATEKITPQIRSMLLEDVEEVYSMGVGIPEFAVSDQAGFWSKDEIIKWVKDNANDVLLIAIYDGKIVGFTFAMYHPLTGLATCTNLFTRKEYRRRGIGKQLLQELIRQIEEKGATYIESITDPANEASIQLQESVGFRKGKLMQVMEKISKKNFTAPADYNS